MELAYSKEYNDVIDAEKAYELYWEDIIKDCRAFTCPEPNCEAQVTLSSVNKERRFLKQVPHYRRFGSHKDGCSMDEQKKTVKEDDDGNPRSSNRYIDQKIDVLVLDRLKGTIETTKDNENKSFDDNRIKRKYKETVEKQGKRESKYVTIMPIVSKFLKYKEEKTLYKHKIVNQGKQISYATVFKSLGNKEYDMFSRFNRVYYGKARIYTVNNRENDFRISFLNKVIYGGKQYIPSAYISKKIIKDSYRNIQWLNELRQVALNSEKVVVFIYGTIKFAKSLDGEREFLNIDICQAKLDFIDIRYIG